MAMQKKVTFLRCAACGGNLNAVTNSRQSKFAGSPTIRRRRECDDCGVRETTYEITDGVLQNVREMTAKGRSARIVGLRAELAELEGRL